MHTKGEENPAHQGLVSGAGHYQDEETGDRVAVVVYVPKKKDVSEGLGGWTVTWQEAHVNIARDKRLNLTDRRVLELLRGVLDFDNWIRISLTEIGDIIEVDRSNVAKAMTKLTELGIVLVGPAVKTVKTYRLSPTIAYKGSLAHAAKERRKGLKLIQGGRKDKHETDVGAENQLPLF
jgi:hypothetical protein